MSSTHHLEEGIVSQSPPGTLMLAHGPRGLSSPSPCSSYHSLYEFLKLLSIPILEASAGCRKWQGGSCSAFVPLLGTTRMPRYRHSPDGHLPKCPCSKELRSEPKAEESGEFMCTGSSEHRDDV